MSRLISPDVLPPEARGEHKVDLHGMLGKEKVDLLPSANDGQVDELGLHWSNRCGGHWSFCEARAEGEP